MAWRARDLAAILLSCAIGACSSTVGSGDDIDDPGAGGQGGPAAGGRGGQPGSDAGRPPGTEPRADAAGGAPADGAAPPPPPPPVVAPIRSPKVAISELMYHPVLANDD